MNPNASNVTVVEALIENGQCNENLMVSECCYDGGDCPCLGCRCLTCSSVLLEKHWLGDGICDVELKTRDCCYDLGDCKCPTCPFSENHLGDLQCDSNLNNHLCCYDLGDCIQSCPTCPIPNYGHVRDSICDIHLFNEACCMDGDDCIGLQTRCPSCDTIEIGLTTMSHYHTEIDIHLGDGYCTDQLNTFECCYDEGDCDTVVSVCPTCTDFWVLTDSSLTVGQYGDGICNWQHGLDTAECCYDNGDCSFLGLCPTCESPPIPETFVHTAPYVQYMHSMMDGLCQVEVSKRIYLLTRLLY